MKQWHEVLSHTQSWPFDRNLYITETIWPFNFSTEEVNKLQVYNCNSIIRKVTAIMNDTIIIITMPNQSLKANLDQKFLSCARGPRDDSNHKQTFPVTPGAGNPVMKWPWQNTNSLLAMQLSQ